MNMALPRAFLSHASLDKGFVSQVYSALGPTLAEYDQATFEPGLLTWEAILKALTRCSLFVLFASSNSMKSDWVAKEIKEAISRLSDRRILKIVVYCADAGCFKLLNSELKNYNIIRVEKSPSVCARQIRGFLAEIKAEHSRTDLFIARDENLADLKRLVIDPSKNYRTIAVSGFERLGRRSIVNRYCRDVHGGFTSPSKSIVVDAASSADDIFRQLIMVQHETLDRTILAGTLADFSGRSAAEKAKFIGRQIREIYSQREFVQFIDDGGLLADDGDVSPLMQSIVAQNEDMHDLIHIFILHRMPTARIQAKHSDIAFFRLPPMTDSQAEISLLHELKRRRVQLDRAHIVKLVSACDGHPSNLDYIIGYIFDGATLNRFRLDEVMSGSREFKDYKRARASSYVSKFMFNNTEQLVIGALASYKALSTEALAALGSLREANPGAVGDALARLYELNIIDSDGSQYRLIRPLRDALERDSRFELKKSESDQLAKTLTEMMDDYGDGDAVPIALLEPGIVAAIRSKSIAAGWARNLILPSHYIWLARESYQAKDFSEAFNYAQLALSLSEAMTEAAKLEAFRFAGLAAARLGMKKALDEIVLGIGRVKTKKAEGNRHFLVGFAARLRGDLQTAQAELEKASAKLRGSMDVQRELIGVHLARGDYAEALSISEELVARAEDNPYALDGYLQAKIATSGNIRELDYDYQFCREVCT